MDLISGPLESVATTLQTVPEYTLLNSLKFNLQISLSNLHILGLAFILKWKLSLLKVHPQALWVTQPYTLGFSFIG